MTNLSVFSPSCKMEGLPGVEGPSPGPFFSSSPDRFRYPACKVGVIWFVGALAAQRVCGYLATHSLCSGGGGGGRVVLLAVLQ